MTKTSSGLGQFILSAILFAGCSPAPQYAFYRLSPDLDVNQVKHTIPGTILVTRPQSSGFISDRPIIFRDSESSLQLKRYRYNLWSETPTRMIQDAIVRILRNQHIGDYVITPAQRATADWIITGSLLRLEHLYSEDLSDVIIEMELSISSTTTRQVIFLQCYRDQVSVSSGADLKSKLDMDEVVRTLNRSLQRLVIQFAEDTASALQQTSVISNTGCK